ncbi:mannose-6-phosphate isomerase, class I [Vibrio sp. SCSIO 43136]|uniref:mannose-6-phosphate isomerase, class I n=1 Tax=Vibrio sp. SCSIO 43136 TaxID=2819101 RepID=UPI002075ACF2|nr:mannose-6-phosphate isomerase, class I [Vibrio sp. SCSIO 43136]USD67232.1 mannose-6-phosphate isomerase, class I [Vibrio sp. SCSIO 43136]
MTIYKLENVIQNYPWGSTTSLNQLFGIANPNQEPQAEIWMGAHPNGCSKTAVGGESLDSLVAEHKSDVLGQYTELRYGELPYLMKVLAASAPLSIQVHPNKKQAREGFDRENRAGIALNAAHRNYKDPNHKPELVYALTFYQALNGFRPIEQILALFEEANIEQLKAHVDYLRQHPNEVGLKQLFETILRLEDNDKADALTSFRRAINTPARNHLSREAFSCAQQLLARYPEDIGVFAPLILNTVELAPGEAMFLHAQTPHAYLSGTGLEIMASSDNVLRAGLTNKHIDIDDLLANTKFVSIAPTELRLAPVHKSGRRCYPVPVDDFGFEIVSVADVDESHYPRSAEILFCVDGHTTLTTKHQTLELSKGDSVFITQDTRCYQFRGEGVFARAFN